MSRIEISNHIAEKGKELPFTPEFEVHDLSVLSVQSVVSFSLRHRAFVNGRHEGVEASVDFAAGLFVEPEPDRAADGLAAKDSLADKQVLLDRQEPVESNLERHHVGEE